MKILVVHWGSNGGGPKYALDMSRALNSVPDVELHVSYSVYVDNFEEWVTLTSRDHRVVTYRSNMEFVTGVLRWARNLISLRRYIKHNGIGVVYSPMLSLWQSLALLCWLPRGSYYLSTIHDAQSHPGDSKLFSRLCQWMELRRADRVVVLTDHVKDELLSKNCLGDISVIPMGVDVALGGIRSMPQSKITIGFFGRILTYKGIDLFVDTILELQERGQNVEGLVFGAGTVDDTLRYRGGKNIVWNNRWIDNSEIDEIFSSFDLLLLPYIEASQSGVISIACRNGVPQVVTPVGGLAEQIDQTQSGLIADFVTADSLSDSVEKILTNGELYRELSVRSNAAGEGAYSWRRSAEKLVDIIANRNE